MTKFQKTAALFLATLSVYSGQVFLANSAKAADKPTEVKTSETKVVETGDPFADFLPPPIVLAPDDQGDKLRAVVILRAGTPKDGQRYVDPLLVLTGEEYARSTFGELHARICDALRGPRPEVVMEAWGPDGSVRLMMGDGTSRLLSPEELKKSRT